MERFIKQLFQMVQFVVFLDSAFHSSIFLFYASYLNKNMLKFMIVIANKPVLRTKKKKAERDDLNIKAHLKLFWFIYLSKR